MFEERAHEVGRPRRGRIARRPGTAPAAASRTSTVVTAATTASISQLGDPPARRRNATLEQLSRASRRVRRGLASRQARDAGENRARWRRVWPQALTVKGGPLGGGAIWRRHCCAVGVIGQTDAPPRQPAEASPRGRPAPWYMFIPNIRITRMTRISCGAQRGRHYIEVAREAASLVEASTCGRALMSAYSLLIQAVPMPRAQSAAWLLPRLSVTPALRAT